MRKTRGEGSNSTGNPNWDAKLFKERVVGAVEYAEKNGLTEEPMMSIVAKMNVESELYYEDMMWWLNEFDAIMACSLKGFKSYIQKRMQNLV